MGGWNWGIHNVFLLNHPETRPDCRAWSVVSRPRGGAYFIIFICRTYRFRETRKPDFRQLAPPTISWKCAHRIERPQLRGVYFITFICSSYRICENTKHWFQVGGAPTRSWKCAHQIERPQLRRRVCCITFNHVFSFIYINNQIIF